VLGSRPHFRPSQWGSTQVRNRPIGMPMLHCAHIPSAEGTFHYAFEASRWVQHARVWPGSTVGRKKGTPMWCARLSLTASPVLVFAPKEQQPVSCCALGGCFRASSYKSAMALLELLDSGWRSHYYSPRLPRLTLSHHNEVMGYFSI
jgi:hypothetical protein